MTGRLVAQGICDWVVRFAKALEACGEYDDSHVNILYSFASVLQRSIDDGVYDL